MKIVKDYSSKTLIQYGIVGLFLGYIGVNDLNPFSNLFIHITLTFLFSALSLIGLGCLILGVINKIKGRQDQL